jgi:hypothetical protein
MTSFISFSGYSQCLPSSTAPTTSANSGGGGGTSSGTWYSAVTTFNDYGAQSGVACSGNSHRSAIYHSAAEGDYDKDSLPVTRKEARTQLQCRYVGLSNSAIPYPHYLRCQDLSPLWTGSKCGGSINSSNCNGSGGEVLQSSPDNVCSSTSIRMHQLYRTFLCWEYYLWKSKYPVFASCTFSHE